MRKWLARLFIVWVANIFVASANEEIVHGYQSLVEAPNEAASATTTGHAAFSPVQRESRTAEDALEKARLQTDEPEDNLVTLRLGNRLTKSRVSLEEGNSQDSSSIATRGFLSDFDKARETDASSSEKHYINLLSNPSKTSSTYIRGPTYWGGDTVVECDKPDEPKIVGTWSYRTKKQREG